MILNHNHQLNHQVILNQNLYMWRMAMKYCLFQMKILCKSTVETIQSPVSIVGIKEDNKREQLF